MQHFFAGLSRYGSICLLAVEKVNINWQSTARSITTWWWLFIVALRSKRSILTSTIDINSTFRRSTTLRYIACLAAVVKSQYWHRQSACPSIMLCYVIVAINYSCCKVNIDIENRYFGLWRYASMICSGDNNGLHWNQLSTFRSTTFGSMHMALWQRA